MVSGVINDHELLAALIRLIIGIVEREALRRELRTPVTAVRVVRIHLIDGGEVNQHVYRQERWDKSANLPLTATFTPQPPLTRPLEAATPLDLALEGPRYPRQVDLGN